MFKNVLRHLSFIYEIFKKPFFKIILRCWKWNNAFNYRCILFFIEGISELASTIRTFYLCKLWCLKRCTTIRAFNLYFIHRKFNYWFILFDMLFVIIKRIISAAIKPMASISHQLSVKWFGAIRESMNSITPTIANNNIKETLKPSFRWMLSAT